METSAKVSLGRLFSKQITVYGCSCEGGQLYALLLTSWKCSPKATRKSKMSVVNMDSRTTTSEIPLISLAHPFASSALSEPQPRNGNVNRRRHAALERYIVETHKHAL